jgi:hypothetical protein
MAEVEARKSPSRVVRELEQQLHRQLLLSDMLRKTRRRRKRPRKLRETSR